MNKYQFKKYISDPMLMEIPLGYTPAASIIILMLIAHESLGGRYIKQLHDGRAFGMIQMEPATHASTWQYGDSIWVNALKCGIITADEFHLRIHPKVTRLLYDLRYNVFMARQRLFMKPEIFPTGRKQMSRYLKKHWNTVHGKANDRSYYDALRDWN